MATAAMVVYTVSPIDAVPEILLGPLGYIDDIGLWGVLSLVFNWERGRFEAQQEARAVNGNATAAAAK